MLALCAVTVAQAPASAEYRAYRIGIRREAPAGAPTGATATAPPPTAGAQERVVVSVLDPIQYAGYYPLQRDESTRLISTWRCKARSDWFAPICPEPKAPSPAPDAAPKDRGPAGGTSK